jgi:acyl-CoA synthetase (NDP forming)
LNDRLSRLLGPSSHTTHPLSKLFNPRSVAIVGASEKSTWTVMQRRCIEGYGFDGRTYAVNRSGSAVFGWPGFTSCSAIGEPVDAAYLCVPQDAVLEAIDDIARAGIRAAVVLTSGYGETGADGVGAQVELAARASALGIALLGPNCLGFANVAAKTAITGISPRGRILENGRVGFVCQSGATAAELLEFAQQQGIGVSFFAATGNEAQIAIADVVDYLVDDPETRVIMVFAETIRHAERFAAAARRALTAGKPIVALKVGASDLGASVAQAHTGSLVGNDRVFSAACARLGIIRVDSVEDLVITAGVLAHTGPLRPGGAGIASISGGACTLIGDHGERAGMPSPPFAAATVARLREFLPSYATTLNPLDVTGAFVRDPAILENALAVIGEDPGIALRLCVMNLPSVEGMTTPTPAMLAAVGRGLARGSTPGLLVVQTIKPVTDVSRRIMAEHGIPGVTGGLDHMVRAVAHTFWWSDRHRAARLVAASALAASEAAPVIPRATAPRPTPARLAPGPNTERDVLDYLAQFGVPVIPAAIARSADEAASHARRFGGRVALKIVSPDITHKTEVGGVRLGLEGEAAVAEAWGNIDAAVRRARPAARIDGVLVSPMRERGLELFVGTARDADWGMVLALGLGGVWVEVLKDTALSLLPICREDVLGMLASLRAARILGGYRGAPAADLAAIAEVVVRIGEAALALGSRAASLEINPLLVDGSRVEALDGLVVWNPD